MIRTGMLQLQEELPAAPAREARKDKALMAEIGRIVGLVSARFARAWRFLDKDELEAEGWQACLASIDGYDPKAGPAEAYFRVITRRALGRFCSRTVAAVSMGKKVAEGAKFQARAELTDWNQQALDQRYEEELGDQLREDPERQALRAEHAAERTSWRSEVQRLVEEAIAGWDKWERWVAKRLYGLDGYPAEKARDLAARIRVDVRRIYRVHARLEKTLWGVPALYKLHKES